MLGINLLVVHNILCTVLSNRDLYNRDLYQIEIYVQIFFFWIYYKDDVFFYFSYKIILASFIESLQSIHILHKL